LAGTLGDTPTCLKELGLQMGCTLEEVDEAYFRQVRIAHPDRGGKIDDFVRLRTAYLDSLQLLGGKR
jgi:curved DNA-binding protein CbpA